MPCVESTSAATAIDSLNKDLTGNALPEIDGTLETANDIMDQWRFSGVTSAGWIGSNALADAIALAIGSLNALIQWKISDLQQDIADSYYHMAKYKWDRFARNYMPLEKKLLQEVSSEPEPKLHCNDDRTRAEQSVNSAYRAMQTYMGRVRKSLHICIDNNILSMVELSRSKMLVDTENYNLIDDQYWRDIMSDDRWNRRSNVLDLGRNIASLAMSYGDTAKQALSTVSPQVNTAASSFVSSIGYFGARNDTVYPKSFITGSSTLSTLPGVPVSAGQIPGDPRETGSSKEAGQNT